MDTMEYTVAPEWESGMEMDKLEPSRDDAGEEDVLHGQADLEMAAWEFEQMVDEGGDDGRDDSIEAKDSEQDQRRIDRAFGKRLAAQRRKWDAEHEKQLHIAGIVQQAIEQNLGPEALYDTIRKADLESVSETPDAEGYARSRQEAAVDPSLVEQLQQEQRQIQMETPDFDLVEQMEASPAFAALIASGESIHNALAYIQRDDRLAQARKAGEREAVSRMMARNSRPGVSQRANAGSQSSGPYAWSDQEMDRIDQALKRGLYVRV